MYRITIVIILLLISADYAFLKCSPASQVYYREAMVYTPFAATLLGLGAIAIISLLDGLEWWKAKKEKRVVTITTGQVLPPHVGNIQSGMIMLEEELAYNTPHTCRLGTAISLKKSTTSFTLLLHANHDFLCSLVPRLLPRFQHATLKIGRSLDMRVLCT